MILYFSGTGNSEYAATRIGKATGGSVLNLFDKIRSRDFSALHANEPWVVVVPTYAWRIPRVVEDWLRRTKLTRSRELYFVMTCGGDAGNAGKYLQKLCKAKKMQYMGCFPVRMPENYIALFATPTQEEALETLRRAEAVIDAAARFIQNRQVFPRPKATVRDRLNSGIVNAAFYPMLVHAKKFYATDACISCGKCAEVCPLRNIRLENGRPVWEDHCTHCMACISRCPREAIEYGAHSKGLTRYVCPKSASEAAE